MGAIILKNATYLSGFNLSEENAEVLKNLSKKFRVRSFNESDFGEFKKSFDQVKYHFCIISQIDESNKNGDHEARKFVDGQNISKIYLDPNDLCPEIKNTNQLIRLGKDDLNGNVEEKVLENLVERFLTRRPPEEVPELDFIELIIIKIGIAIAKATVIAFNKKIKYSNKISIIQIKRLTTVPVRQEASVAAKRALKAIFNNVPRMSGQIAERPPSKIPTLEIFAKPQIP